MKSEDELIYDLIFSEKSTFNIDISEYITDIYKYEEYVDHLRNVLKKSKVKIVKSSVIVDSKTVVWDLKVKK